MPARRRRSPARLDELEQPGVHLLGLRGSRRGPRSARGCAGRARRRRPRPGVGARPPRPRSGRCRHGRRRRAGAGRVARRARGRSARARVRFGHAAVDRERVQALDGLGPEPAGDPLVGDGRVDESVADDVDARARAPARSPARRARPGRRRTAAARPSGRARSQASLSSSRTRSPASVPPGSRSSSAGSPSASASIAAWVVFPERSIPSRVMNTVSACCFERAGALGARGAGGGFLARRPPAPAVGPRGLRGRCRLA